MFKLPTLKQQEESQRYENNAKEDKVREREKERKEERKIEAAKLIHNSVYWRGVKENIICKATR